MGDTATWSNFRTLRDFLGNPVVKTSSSDAGDVGYIPGGGAKIPHFK